MGKHELQSFPPAVRAGAKTPKTGNTGEAVMLIFVLTALIFTGGLSESATTQRVLAADFQYLGAFRLPGGDIRPATFSYGGSALTYNPDGDPEGPADGFPGSLFISGHDRLPYGELPDGNQVAEVCIPVPVITKNPALMNRAIFLQWFRNVSGGLFDTYDEIPRMGMQYLSKAATGPKIHLSWGQHFHESPEDQAPTHAWLSPSLSAPDVRGSWYIGHQSLYSVNDYMLEIPAAWANRNSFRRYLGTGRYRDGGWSGQGPSLFAYCPWVDSSGTPAAPGTHLPETVLLLYENSQNTENVTDKSLAGYQHADEWAGGAWITTSTGKSAVLFAGTKGAGAKYWYGWINPAGPEFPCVETELIGQFTLCRLADGSECPPEDLAGCEGHSDYRGWWSSRFEGRFFLYDPADFVRVSNGQMSSWEPQPYTSIDIDGRLLLNPGGVEEDMIGTGAQRRYRLGSVAYDRANDLLYVLELFADGTKPVVHVWRVRGTTFADSTPDAFTLADQTGVPPNRIMNSNTIIVQGIDAPAPVSITACTSSLCEYSINGAPYVTGPGSVNSGFTVSVRQRSSPDFNITTNLTLNIGGVTDTFSLTTSNHHPTLGALTPSSKISEAGLGQTFAAVYSDADGHADLKTADFLVSPSGGGSDAIWVRYNRVTGELMLYNDAGTAPLPERCVPGVAETLQNSRGRINCGLTTVAESGNNLTMKWRIVPKTAFAGATPMKLKMKSVDKSGATSGWEVKGSWTINP